MYAAIPYLLIKNLDFNLGIGNKSIILPHCRICWNHLATIFHIIATLFQKQQQQQKNPKSTNAIAIDS